MKIYAILRDGNFVAAFSSKEFAHKQAEMYGDEKIAKTVEVRAFTDDWIKDVT